VLGAALCFGSTFPVTKEALGEVGPYGVVALRFLLGGLVLLPFALRRPAAITEGRAVAWASLWLFAGYASLTVGLQETSSTAAAFICYLLVVIVPVLSAVVLRRPPTPAVAAGVVLATAGLFLLAGDGLRLGRGELLVLGCAFAFAVHILVLDRFAAGVDVVRLTSFQLLVVGVAALVPAVVGGDFAGLDAGSALACGWLGAAGLAGLLLQIAGQRTVGPARTSLLLMLEPVLAAVGGYVIGERIAPLGFLGAALILTGIIVSELPLDRRVRLPG
jgi:drug/metabolite transporter (DMT)-like permease